jgi:hypothetical protein
MNEQQILYALAGVLGVVVVYWHLSAKSGVDLQYLLLDTETKKFSIFKAGQVMALIVSTWIMVRETNHDRLSEWLFTAYMFTWAGSNLANRVISKGATNADTASK